MKTIAEIMEIDVEDLVVCPAISAKRKKSVISGECGPPIEEELAECGEENTKSGTNERFQSRLSLPSVWVGRMREESKVFDFDNEILEILQSSLMHVPKNVVV